MDDLTTKCCKKCGIEKPLTDFYARKGSIDGRRNDCIACCKAWHRAYYFERPDRDQVLAYHRQYSNDRYRNDPKRRVYQAKWLKERRRNHPETHLQWAREYKKRRWDRDPIYRAHVRQHLANLTRKRRSTPEGRAIDAWYARRYHRLNYYNNPEYRKQKLINSRISDHRRRARIAACGGSFTQAEWAMLCDYYDHRCLCCGERKRLTIDHVLPIALGGSNSIDNIQPLCLACNLKKHAKHVDYRP